ncbi:hypothetical protein FQZ97_479210 [compost metagenome]
MQGFAAGLLEDLAFHRGVGEADLHVQQEAVELRLRQRVGAFLLDGVLGGHDHEQRRQVVGRATHRDLPFGHGFEQRRLHLGRRAVDLVGEHQVVEDRPLLEHEAAGFRTVDLGAGDVRRQQVGGELDAVELRLDAFGQLLDRLGLGQPRGAFHQQVAVGEEGDQQAVDELFLAENLGRQEVAQHHEGFTVFHREGSWPGRRWLL